jgi:hypothetical protein
LILSSVPIPLNRANEIAVGTTSAFGLVNTLHIAGSASNIFFAISVAALRRSRHSEDKKKNARTAEQKVP